MRRVVEHRGFRYTVSPDVDAPVGTLTSAIVIARLIDELTNEPPRGSIAIETDTPGLTPRVAQDGIVGFAGIPSRAFTRLDTQVYSIPLEIAASGYVPLRRTVSLGPQAGFPGSFVPADLGDIRVHREPVVILGRVIALSGLAETPVAGANVRVTGMWRTAPPSNMTVLPDPPNLVSLLPAVYFDRDTVADRVRRREMAPVAGDSRTLLEDARAESATLRVSNRIGLAAGVLLMIDGAEPERTEFMTVLSIDGASTPDQPATVTLTYPLRNTHRTGVDVQRVTPQAPGADNAFAAAAEPGDACVLLTSMTDLAAATAVELTGGAQPSEFHLLRRFEAVTDAAGFYRLPPVSRIAQLQIEADDGANPPLTRTVSPDYGLVENHVDFTFA